MVFSDLIFIFLFLPVCLCLYFAFNNLKIRNGLLIIFSLLFYSFGEPKWVSLLIISSLVDYFNGLFIEKHRGEKISVLGIVFSLAFNLGVLAVFKYGGFFVSNINSWFDLNLAVPQFSPPIGLSFYSFQTISYTVDVYRGNAKVQKNFFNFLLYVSMFFQLVAGPIVRYTDVSRELSSRSITAKNLSDGFSRFAFGLGKKVIIANSVGEIAAELLTFENAPSSVLAVWSGVILYSLQIYFDFSGYSDMAIGLGKMFGFNLTENFNYPYISKSAAEFWRRWHISMGSFFRDYVYIPLGGNRRHQALNLAIVWILTGLWHGASWNFVIWGAYFGILVTTEKFFYGNFLKKIPAFFSHLYLIFIVMIGWLIFYFEDLGKIGTALGAMFGANDIPLYDTLTVSKLEGILFVIIIAFILSTPIFPKILGAIEKSSGKSVPLDIISDIVMIALVIAVFALSCILLVKQTSYNPFLYFRF